MRSTIPLLVVAFSLATFGGWSGVRAHAAEESKDITRVTIAISGGPVAYTDQLRENPPAIVIEFRSRNVIAAMESSVVINAGIIKEIQSDYYPPGRRALKSLTLTLVQPAAYTIAQQANQIVVTIETPPGLLPGRMAIGGLTILGMEARETLISRLKAMGDALQQAAPPVSAESAKPKPVVVTQPVQIPVAIVQPAPAPIPVSRKGLGGFSYGVLLGIGGTLVAVAGWRRRRKAPLTQVEPSAISIELPSIAQGASVLEQLVLKALQRQGQPWIISSSKAIAGLGRLWVIQKDNQRQGLVCLGDGGFLERKILDQFFEALQQEGLQSGTVYALGAFTAPAQSFAKEKEINLIPREEVFKLMEVELKSAALVLDEEMLKQQLVKPQAELVQAQEHIEVFEHKVAELKAALGAKETEVAQKERVIGELTAISNQSVQEVHQLKAKSAEVDQRLAAEREKRAQLEAQIAKLEEQLKAQAATVADLPAALAASLDTTRDAALSEVERAAQAGKVQLIQESAEAAKDTIKAVAAEEPKATQEVLQVQEHRTWPRFDLSRHKGKGVLVRATSNDGEPMNGDARNISAGGLCVELPSGERLADEFELKLFLPDRTKPIEAIGKLVWKGRGSRRKMEQLGVAFSAVNAPDQETISQFVLRQRSGLTLSEAGGRVEGFVEERKPKPVTVG